MYRTPFLPSEEGYRSSEKKVTILNQITSSPFCYEVLLHNISHHSSRILSCTLFGHFVPLLLAKSCSLLFSTAAVDTLLLVQEGVVQNCFVIVLLPLL
mmetsp:Transcript_23457/g.34885  ORF Transcript_23457/g.34885 Transcript_23457/m.34885 type:complete len:98 (+) Transcript_23457:102-395(+)